MAQAVEHPTLGQVMISRFMGSGPTSGSVQTAWNLLGILSPSASPQLVLARSLSK